MLEKEVILNSTPLCPLYDDDFEEPLTPNHLLFGRKLPQTNVKVEYCIDVSISLKRVRHIETLAGHFWGRWRREYVATLRTLQQKSKKQNSIVPTKGIVLVFEE